MNKQPVNSDVVPILYPGQSIKINYRKPLFLNLGVGNSPIDNTVGVDIKCGKYVDEVVDLRKIPWKWADNSIDGIYMIHSLEHFEDNIAILRECHRILKPGGFIYVQTPHSSSPYVLADLGHKTCYALSTLMRLDGSGYMGIHWFKPTLTRIFYLYQPRTKYHPYVPFTATHEKTNHPILRFLGSPFAWLIQCCIDLSPILFERFWYAYVGGAEECVFMGVKV